MSDVGCWVLGVVVWASPAVALAKAGFVSSHFHIIKLTNSHIIKSSH